MGKTFKDGRNFKPNEEQVKEREQKRNQKLQENGKSKKFHRHYNVSREE